MVLINPNSKSTSASAMGSTNCAVPLSKRDSCIASHSLFDRLVSVSVRLERTLRANTDVISLFLRQCGELRANGGQVQSRHLLIEVLGKKVHVVFVGLGLLPVLHEVELSQDLVSEGAR